jgi:hypothetical protein
MSLPALLLLAPVFAQLIYWDQVPASADRLRAQGITRIAVPAAQAAAWKSTGLVVVPVTPEQLRGREAFEPPGVDRDIAVASPTQRPWIDASGWRFLRQRPLQAFYDLPAGRGPLAVAEAHLWGLDALFRIDARDLPAVARVLAQLRDRPALPWPEVAQIEVVDDGGEPVGEVLNLLSRRNLLWRPRHPGAPPGPPPALVVQLGTAAYPAELAKDPDALSTRVRHHLGDDRRALRVYGSEAVLARLQVENGRADGRARLSLLNYASDLEEGVRVRVRGVYPRATVVTDRVLPQAPLDPRTAGGFTELTVPPFAIWAVLDLAR